MKGFKLNDQGDIVFEKRKIVMTKDSDLVRQTVVSVLKTNKGEWFLNKNEGINFYNILGKKPTKEVVRDEVQAGIRQVDSNFMVTEFSMSDENRKLEVSFQANNGTETIEGGAEYA